MRSQRRQQYYGMATGLFLLLLGTVGTINLAMSDHGSSPMLLRKPPPLTESSKSLELSESSELTEAGKGVGASMDQVQSHRVSQDSGLSKPSPMVESRVVKHVMAQRSTTVGQRSNVADHRMSGRVSVNSTNSLNSKTILPEQAITGQTNRNVGNEKEIARGFKPRLPPYYSQLVTPQQRERIYWIQKRYHVELEKLRLQIDKYEQQRDQYIHACLTAEQQMRLMQLRAGK